VDVLVGVVSWAVLFFQVIDSECFQYFTCKNKLTDYIAMMPLLTKFASSFTDNRKHVSKTQNSW